jgi:hypothetical protein
LDELKLVAAGVHEVRAAVAALLYLFGGRNAFCLQPRHQATDIGVLKAEVVNADGSLRRAR